MSTLTNKNIFVTGATGLVGSHLVEHLFRLKPNRVVCLCRSKDPTSIFYMSGLDSKVICAYGDLKDKGRVFDVVTKYEISHIFHVAAQAIVPTAFINPYETLSTNIMGTVNILEAARLSPLTTAVIVASSDKAYGKDCCNAIEDHALSGDHPYDVSKSCADLIALTYAKTYGMPVSVSRFGNIYGPGDLNFNRIIPGIMKAVISDELLEIRSDGTFKRDYVYVKDVVDGYIQLAEQINKSKGEAFNFSSGINLSVIELIDKVEKILNKGVNYKIVNDQHNEIPVQSLNFDKARRILEWKPKRVLTDSIRETWRWYKGYFKEDPARKIGTRSR